jgi:hypothetical protein
VKLKQAKDIRVEKKAETQYYGDGKEWTPETRDYQTARVA